MGESASSYIAALQGAGDASAFGTPDKRGTVFPCGKHLLYQRELSPKWNSGWETWNRTMDTM